jgi:hypothetical protein
VKQASGHQLLQSFCKNNRLKSRMDSDGTLIVPGKLGHIYEYDGHSLAVIVIPATPHKNYWTFTRKKLVSLGFKIVQNGDCEGAASFDPANPDHARAAIRAAGIPRKRWISPEQIDRQISWLKASAGGVL